MSKEQEAYEQLMSEWFDECAMLVDGFRSLFAPNAEGEMKYLMALHMMVMTFCGRRRLPPESFFILGPVLTAIWVEAGKPEVFEVRGANLIDLLHRINHDQN